MFILLFHSYSIVLIWEALNGAMLCVVIYPWNWGYDSINGQTFRITEFSHKICTWIVLHRIDKYTELVLLTMTCFYPDTFRKKTHTVSFVMLKNCALCCEYVSRYCAAGISIYMNIALRRFLHNHGTIATEGSPKTGLCPTLILNDFKGSS